MHVIDQETGIILRPGGDDALIDGAVTLADVAALARVAPITAARALNNPDSVSEPLRARIRAAVAQLGYVPNRMAGALASAKTKVIPVIVPALSNVVFIEVIEAVQEALAAHGCQLLLGTTDYNLEREAVLVSALLGWAPPGVMIAGLRHLPRTTAILKNAGLPVVEMMEYGTRCIDMNVGLSHFRAGTEMAEHLLARGYRKTGFIGARLRDDYRARQRSPQSSRHASLSGAQRQTCCWPASREPRRRRGVLMWGWNLRRGKVRKALHAFKNVANWSLSSGCQRGSAGRFLMMSCAAQRIRLLSVSRVTSLSGQRM
jgi:LacI family gluconate utilization system Gnt-I transcriptional repressor